MPRPRATAKAGPISINRLVKIRDREQQFCPFCGATVSLEQAQKVRSMGWFILDCPTCRHSFCLPYPRSFDPAVPAPVKLDAYRWADCPFCKIRFRFDRRYEQCPCCGKLLFEHGSRFEFELRDNAAEVLRLAAQFRKRTRAWWPF